MIIEGLGFSFFVLMFWSFFLTPQITEHKTLLF
nr:MAG TPA: hypothetical protein [Caudoviricetes sp.]